MAEFSAEDPPARLQRRGSVIEPVHVLIGSMPVAYFLLAFLIDLTYVKTAYFIWPFFSVWLISAGLVTGCLAMGIGLIEWLIHRREIGRRGLRLHGLMTIAALILGFFNAFIHSRDGWTSVVPEGIILSAITTVLLIVAAFLGAASRRAA